MKLHRAAQLIVLMLLSLGALGLLLAGALRSLDRRSLIALGVVLAGAAAGGLAFSWKRYFPKRAR
jgi:protein-S-isoprenylcysteine O-methyltransferase Ste14